MNYEFALKLKEAGWPQSEFEKGKFVCIHGEPENPCGTECYNPTLSELIEACGNGLQSLINNFDDYSKSPKGWIAFTNRKDEKGERMEIWGETPEEAVGELWLILNK